MHNQLTEFAVVMAVVFLTFAAPALVIYPVFGQKNRWIVSFFSVYLLASILGAVCIALEVSRVD